MKKMAALIGILLTLAFTIQTAPLIAQNYTYQNYNHGYCSECDCNACPSCCNPPDPTQCPTCPNNNYYYNNYDYCQGDCPSGAYGQPYDPSMYYEPSPYDPSVYDPSIPTPPEGVVDSDPCADDACDTCDNAPCAPVCGCACGISCCAIGIGIAAVAAAAAIIVSSGNGDNGHNH